MKHISGILTAFALCLSTINGFADDAKIAAADLQGAKIGVVDLQSIMQTSNQMKIIQKKLAVDFQPRRVKLEAMEKKLRDDMEALQRDSAVLSEMQKKDREKKIHAAQQAFERDAQQYQQELSTAHNDAMEVLYGKIRKAIAKVAANEKYTLILQQDAAPFSSKELNVTDKVMREIS
jgi:outer membrane protein